jgi:hypothetical protein
MSHLGEAASAFVDGALDDETAWRVSTHLARCRNCRAEVEAERALKAQLRVERSVPTAPALPAGLAAALLGIAAQPAIASHASPAAPAATIRRPAARVVQAAPRRRADVGGPGRSVRSGGRGRRMNSRYVAAAGIAASVMVGLGGGSLAGGAGTLAGGANGPASSTPTASAAAVVTVAQTVAQTPTPTVPLSLSSLLPVEARSIVRPSTRTALSVVYRQP